MVTPIDRVQERRAAVGIGAVRPGRCRQGKDDGGGRTRRSPGTTRRCRPRRGCRGLRPRTRAWPPSPRSRFSATDPSSAKRSSMMPQTPISPRARSDAPTDDWFEQPLPLRRRPRPLRRPTADRVLVSTSLTTCHPPRSDRHRAGNGRPAHHPPGHDPSGRQLFFGAGPADPRHAADRRDRLPHGLPLNRHAEPEPGQASPPSYGCPRRPAPRGWIPHPTSPGGGLHPGRRPLRRRRVGGFVAGFGGCGAVGGRHVEVPLNDGEFGPRRGRVALLTSHGRAESMVCAHFCNTFHSCTTCARCRRAHPRRKERRPRSPA